MEQGQIIHKKEPAMIRPAVKGERVVTYVAGRVISDVVVPDDTSWVVKAPTKEQEEYVLNSVKFTDNWNSEGQEPTETAIYTQRAGYLARKGYKLHHPKLVLKWTYEIQEADLDGLPSRTLKTEWGALQTIISGDYLTLPYPETKANEIYIIPNAVVKGVYKPFEAENEDNSDDEEVRMTKLPTLPGDNVWASIRMLKSEDFNRATRGDIVADTKVILHAFEQPYNLLFRYQMEEAALVKWIGAIEEQYNKLDFHSWAHAFDVFQFIYASLTVGGGDQYFHFQDIMALLLGALAHDVGHMGLSNNFLMATQDKLATMYNDKSPLEAMHASIFFQTLQRPGLNFLSAMSPENFRSFRAKVIGSILATDMIQHFKLVDRLSMRVMQAKQDNPPIVTKKGEDADDAMQCEGDVKLLVQAFMHMADQAHCVKPFYIHKHIVVLFEEEFFKQGDEERKLGMPISPLMDRSRHSAASSQTFHLSKVVLPFLTPWVYFLLKERADLLLQNLEANRARWEALVLEHIPKRASSGGATKTAKAIVASTR